MTEVSDELRERMREEAHEKLDELLDRKETWRYPLVVTVSVESPAVRHLVGEEDPDA